MNRLIALMAVAALGLPCAASDPRRLPTKVSRSREVRSSVPLAPPAPRAFNPPPAIPVPPPPKLLDSDLLRMVLLPHHALAEWAVRRIAVAYGFGYSGNVLGLQVPWIPTPDLNVPIRPSLSNKR